MLGVALSLSAIAAFYSIIGLAAIFAAAVIPIVIMGTILEIAKLTVTVWLHEYWRQCKLTMKAYLVPAVGILMLITSMGIFGFLSKAHLDQAVPAGDISAQVTIFDEKIRTQRDNIEAARAALRQLDAAVDQTMGRSNDEKGAERAVQIRRSQQAERTRLQNDIGRAQTEITRLQEQRAPIAAQARKVEAEVGPIKYIAALIYGDNPDANLLEKAVRWVIIILVTVFDPLAVMMLLAATESYRWERNKVIDQRKDDENDSEPHGTNPAADLDHTPDHVDDRPSELVAQSGEPMADRPAQPNLPSESVVLDPPEPTSVPVSDTTYVPDEPEADDVEDDDDDRIKAAKNLWKHDNPNRTLKEMRRLYDKGQISELPWEAYLDRVPPATSTQIGRDLPQLGTKGDLFIDITVPPSRVYKYNGDRWVEIGKTNSDQYAYDDNYISYLIEAVGKGEYDPDLLTETERNQIKEKISLDI